MNRVKQLFRLMLSALFAYGIAVSPLQAAGAQNIVTGEGVVHYIFPKEKRVVISDLSFKIDDTISVVSAAGKAIKLSSLQKGMKVKMVFLNKQLQEIHVVK